MDLKISRDPSLWLTFPKDLSPLIMKAPTRHQHTRRGRLRLKTSGPPSSSLSETFTVCRYQKYTEGVVCAHSGSEGTWLWMRLPDRVPHLWVPPFSPPPFVFPSIFLFLVPPPSYFLFQIPFQLSFSPSLSLWFPLTKVTGILQ